MTLPAVDLRAGVEQVYHQAGSNACTAHALTNLFEAMYGHAGQDLRFSRAWVWWWSRVNSGRSGQDVGATFPDLQFAVQQRGMVLEADHPWTGAAFNPPPKGLQSRIGKATFIRVPAEVESIKRRLCHGVPTGIGITLNSAWYSLYGQKDWRKTSYDVRAPYSSTQHAMCIVGYDDAAGRLLIENSEGPSFADGGFFGLPYEHLPLVLPECWTVGRIEGFNPKPVEGYVSIPYILSARDHTDFLVKNKPKLRDMAKAAYERDGFPGVIQLCKDWQVSDKLLENLFLWERLTVKRFCEANPGLDWAGFPWAEEV